MCLLIQDVKSEKVKFVQSKFEVGDFKHSERKVKSVKKDKTYESELMKPFVKRKNTETYSEDIYVDEKGVYHYVVPHCSKCNSRNVIKHDTNDKDLEFEDGTKRKIKVKRYTCKNCGKGSQVEFKDEFEPYSRISSKVKTTVRKLNGLRHISLGNLKKILKITKGISVSREYIRKAQIMTNKLYWRNPSITTCNYVSFDVQWIPVDEGWNYLHVLTDIDKNEIVAIKLTKDEETNTSTNFVKEALRIGSAKAIVTDLKPGYLKISNELNMKHQLCSIHFRKAVSEKIRKILSRHKTIIKGNYLNENPDIPEEKLKKHVKEDMKEIIEEYNDYKKEIFEFYDKETYKEAQKCILKLKTKSRDYPEALRTYLDNEFFPIHSHFILYKHRDFKGKIPRTNNISEQKIHFCATQSEKKQYRTPLGFFNHVLSRIKFSKEF